MPLMDTRVTRVRLFGLVRCLPYVIVGLAALFYVYEFFLRVVLSTISHELMFALNVDAAGLGVVSAGFYYAYTIMQIPAGLLCDRFGPKRLLTLAVGLCCLAAYLFSTTSSALVAFLSRFLIGFSSSFAFVGPLALAARWFDSKRFALIAGLIQLMGCLGAIVGETPVAILTARYGWRQVVVWSAFFGVILAVLFALILRNGPKRSVNSKPGLDAPPSQNGLQAEWRRLKTVCASPQTWWVACVAFACWGPIVVFAELWGVTFFMELQHINATQATSEILWIWLGIGLGSPLMGWWSNRIFSRRLPLLICYSLALFSTVWIVYLPVPSIWFMDGLMFFLGFSAAAQPVTFGLVGDNNPPEVVGTAVGFNNMAVISGGVILQPLVGYVLRYFWDGTFVDNVPFYTVESFEYAFVMMPLCAVLGLVVTLFFIKETHCKEKEELVTLPEVKQ